MRDRKSQTISRGSSSKILTLGLALMVAMSLVMSFPPTSEAAANTTIHVHDMNGAVKRAKVMVFDACNGRQVANGLTDTETGLFTFSSSKRSELIVVVFTSSRLLGTARITSGKSAVVLANQDPDSIPLINDPLRTGALTFTDEEGAPLADASIALVGTRSFEAVVRGGTDEEGRFSFRVPDDPTEIAYLATLWTEDGEISLVGVLTFAGRPQTMLFMPSIA
jgi:hypothetical protein